MNVIWGTTKTHGKPAQAMFYGQDVKTPWAEGVLVNITIDRSGFTALNAETGERVACGGVATRYWAAPVTTTTQPEEEVTTIVAKGANRPAAARKTAKAAQRTPLPPKGATSSAGKNETAEVIKDELAKPAARKPRVPNTETGKKLAAQVAAKNAAPKKTEPVRATPHDKANALVEEATRLGWVAAAEKGETAADIVTFKAVRGGEEVVTLHWITGGTRPGSYLNGARRVQAMNAATVRRILASPAEAAAKVRAAYASGKGKAVRAAVKVATAAPLSFTADSDDYEIIMAVAGRTVTWINSISGLNETAVVAGAGKNAPKITGEGDKRALVFPAKGEGFRTVRLSSIVSVS